MRREKDVWTIVVADAIENVDAFPDDIARVFTFTNKARQPVQKNVLRSKPAHILPHVQRDLATFGFTFFWKGFAKIVHGDTVSAKQRPDLPRGRSNETEGRICGKQPQKAQYQQYKFCHQPVLKPAEAPQCFFQGRPHCNRTALRIDAQDDLAENVAAFHALQCLSDIVKPDFRVNDRMSQASRHLVHGVGHVLHPAAEGTEYF